MRHNAFLLIDEFLTAFFNRLELKATQQKLILAWVSLPV